MLFRSHEAGELLRLDRRVLIVTDEGVPRQYAETLAAQCRAARVHTVPQGEAAKSPAVLTQLLESMLNFGLSRGDCAAAVGGGVVGDLTGLAAALYLRGVDWYNLPTTTLSMTDSAIGGKTAVNLGGVKNSVVGIFDRLNLDLYSVHPIYDFQLLQNLQQLSPF